MATKVKSSHISKSASKNVVNAASLQQVVNAAASIAAPAGAGVGSGAAAPAVSAVSAGAAGVAAPAKVRQSNNSQLAASLVREDSDISVKSLCSRIAARFAAPEWAGAAALRAALAPLVDDGTMSLDQYEATLNAAARKAGVVVPICSVPRVLAVIRSSFRSDFESVCGCSFAAALSYYRGGAAGVFSLRLPLGLVQADSEFSDFVSCTALAAGASASAVVRSVLSFRFVASFNAARSAAAASARGAFFESLAVAFRAGNKLGITLKEMQEYLEEVSVSVPAADAADAARLNRSLSRSLRSLAAVEYGSNGCARSDRGLLFYLPSLFDDDFRLSPAAVLPSSGVPAAARKLWAKRVRLLSVISTLEGLLARC